MIKVSIFKYLKINIKTYLTMTKYISKSFIMKEIEKIYNEGYRFLSSDLVESVQDFKDDLLLALDNLETKDVDFEKELKGLDSLLYDLDGVAIKGTTHYLTVEDVKDIARCFYEFGLNTQKGGKK